MYSHGAGGGQWGEINFTSKYINFINQAKRLNEWFVTARNNDALMYRTARNNLTRNIYTQPIHEQNIQLNLWYLNGSEPGADPGDMGM